MVSHTALFGVLAALASIASAAGAPSVDLSYARRDGPDGSITYSRAAVARNFPRPNKWAGLERRAGCEHGAWSCANNVLQICSNGAIVPMHDCSTIGATCTTSGWVGCLPNGMSIGGGATQQTAPPAQQPAPPATSSVPVTDNSRPAPAADTTPPAPAADTAVPPAPVTDTTTPAPPTGGDASPKGQAVVNQVGNAGTGVTPAPDYIVEMVDGSPFDPSTEVCIEWEDEVPPPPPPPKKSCGKQQQQPVNTPQPGVDTYASPPLVETSTTPLGDARGNPTVLNTSGQQAAKPHEVVQQAKPPPATEPTQTQTQSAPAQQRPAGQGPKSLVQAPYYVVYNQATPLPADPAELGPINVINLAFWTTKKVDTYAAKFLADPNRKQIIDAYHKAGKVIMLAAFGQFDDPTAKDPVKVAKEIAKIVKDEGLDGIDCDLEHGLKIGEKGAQWGIDFTKAARAELGPDYFITHAPQGPHFTDTVFEYNKIVKGAGDDIDFYNIQYYNQYPAGVYATCDQMVVKEPGYPGSSLAELHASGIPWEKLVLGKPLIPRDAGNLYMEPAELAKCVAQGKALGWPGSFMAWALHAPADAVKTYNTVIGAK